MMQENNSQLVGRKDEKTMADEERVEETETQDEPVVKEEKAPDKVEKAAKLAAKEALQAKKDNEDPVVRDARKKLGLKLSEVLSARVRPNGVVSIVTVYGQRAFWPKQEG